MVVLNNQESQYKVPDTDLNIEGLTDDELRTYLNHKTLNNNQIVLSHSRRDLLEGHGG